MNQDNDARRDHLAAQVRYARQSLRAMSDRDLIRVLRASGELRALELLPRKELETLWWYLKMQPQLPWDGVGTTSPLYPPTD